MAVGYVHLRESTHLIITADSAARDSSGDSGVFHP